MMKHFHRSERGFALVLTLIFMPVFIGVGLLVIDIGRGNNAQADHQAAADALALAGARELDGQSGARQDARAAMENVVNNVSFLGPVGSEPIELAYESGTTAPFTVIFLTQIPEEDDEPIDQDWVNKHVATTDASARYVYVYSQADDLSTLFFNPLTQSNETVPVAASAVATMETVTCDLAPMYMCSPFGTFDALKTEFDNDRLHAKLLRLKMNPSDTQTPGNIGFLRTGDPDEAYDFENDDIKRPKGGTKNLMAALAGGGYYRCVKPGEAVWTQTGASPRALLALNTRFGAYINGPEVGDFGPNGRYPPSKNVRKGWKPVANSDCGEEPNFTGAKAGEKKTKAYADNPVFSENTAPVIVSRTTKDASGKDVTTSVEVAWNLSDPVTVNIDGQEVTYPPYWKTIYEVDPPQITSSVSGEMPSRYDVYRYELADQLLLEEEAPGDEVGTPKECFQGTPVISNPFVDRRTMLMAVVDCQSLDPINGTKEIPVAGYVEVFLTHPAGLDSGNNGVMNIEIYDAYETQDSGAKRFLRTEAFLVR